MSFAQVLGLIIPLAVSIALLMPLYILAVAVVDLVPVPEHLAGVTIGVCVVTWISAVTIAMCILMPKLSTSFGYLMRKTLLKRWEFPESIAELFFEMRITLGVFFLAQILTAVTAFFLMGSNTKEWIGATPWNPVLIGSMIFIFFGTLTSWLGNQAFLKTRGRKLRNWLAHCWRGVALRNFIPEWDNPSRPIFYSCRASRRLAMAYRAIRIGAAGCYAAAGCLAATTVGESLPGFLLCIVAAGSTLMLWPTSTGILEWTKQVVDPILGDVVEE